MKKIFLFLTLIPNLCFSQLGNYHVMRAVDGSVFDTRTTIPNIPSGQILVGNVSGVGTAVTTTGDVTISNTGVAEVVGIRSRPVNGTAPTTNQILKWNGSAWTPSDGGTGTGVNGRVVFWTGPTSQGQNTNLFWDNLNSRFSIGGNLAPVAPLHITTPSGIVENKVIEFERDGGFGSSWIKNYFQNGPIDSRGITFGGTTFSGNRENVLTIDFAYGRVGVNKQYPDHPFVVSGLDNTNGVYFERSTTNKAGIFVNSSGDGVLKSTTGFFAFGSNAQLLSDINPDAPVTAFGLPAPSATTDRCFSLQKSGYTQIYLNAYFDSGTTQNGMYINDGTSNLLTVEALNNRIGVNTNFPVTELDVTGVSNSSVGYRVNNTATLGQYLRGNGTNIVLSGLLPADLTQSTASTGQVLSWNGSIWAPTSITSIGAWSTTGNSVAAGTQFLGSTNNVSLRFRTNNIQRVMIDSTGNVGIANNTPTEKLDVTGNIRFSGALMPNNTAGTSGQVLTSAGAGTVPTWTTNTSESTKIGVFSNSTDPKGLTLSGDSIKLMSASLTRPGAINLIAQSFSAGAGAKLFQSSGSVSIKIDNAADTGEAGIGFTQLSGADDLAYIQVNSTDSDNARMQFLVEEGGGSYDPKLVLGSLNDEKGVYQGSGLYEDVTTVTTSPYTVIYGDRNVYLDGSLIDVNLQAIGTSTGETKIGRVIYFFNDNATSATLIPNGSETINDSSTLVLPANTGVTLLAVTGTKWVTRD